MKRAKFILRKSKQKGKHAQEEKGNHCPHAKLDDKIK
jgi:hypothetical protein